MDGGGGGDGGATIQILHMFDVFPETNQVRAALRLDLLGLRCVDGGINSHPSPECGWPIGFLRLATQYESDEH